MAPTYRADIDGILAVAVLAVVGFHAFPTWITGGFIGVDIFFVISGFLISTILVGALEAGRFSLADFYSRRVRRIFPALLLVLIACAVAGWFTLLPEDYRQLAIHILGGAGFASNLLLWSESGYFDADAATKPLLHLWSLGLEEQFYIVWPLLLWAAYKLRANVLAVAVALAAASLALEALLIQHDATAAFYSPPARFWELLAGAMLAMRKRAVRSNSLSFAGAALIGTGLALITERSAFPGWWAALPVTGAALIIAAGPDAWLNRRLLSNRVMVWFGCISYPLYLWHWPLLAFARILETARPPFTTRVAAVLLSILLAWLTYVVVEKPIRLGNRSRAVPLALAGAMAALAGAGYLGYVQAGFASRFPPMVQAVTQFKYDHAADYREGSCLLFPEQDYAAFGECASEPAGKPTLLLWGDSYAAHLYSGATAVLGDHYRIVQRTAASCPPILGLEVDQRPHCRDINDRIHEWVRRERPARVLLSAKWTKFAPAEIVPVTAKLQATITHLRAEGVTGLTLVGPFPVWKDSLVKQLYKFALLRKPQALPARMTFGLDPYFRQLDPNFEAVARATGVEYVSPARILCNESGCLTRMGDAADTLASFDEGHLTRMASQYVVARFP